MTPSKNKGITNKHNHSYSCTHNAVISILVSALLISFFFCAYVYKTNKRYRFTLFLSSFWHVLYIYVTRKKIQNQNIIHFLSIQIGCIVWLNAANAIIFALFERWELYLSNSSLIATIDAFNPMLHKIWIDIHANYWFYETAEGTECYQLKSTILFDVKHQIE